MMDDSELVALARSMVPLMRECVAEAFAKTAMPAELAEQVASAVRMLHESPPLAAASDKDPIAVKWPLPRISRIERDENGALVPIYDEPQA